MAGELIGALNSILNKIENSSARALQQSGEYVEQEFSEMIQKQVYGSYSPRVYSRTGALGESPRMVSLSKHHATIIFRDLGNWSSVITGEPFFALLGLESGSTWGRNATNIGQEISSDRFKRGIGDEYYEAMLAQGIPIVRR